MYSVNWLSISTLCVCSSSFCLSRLNCKNRNGTQPIRIEKPEINSSPIFSSFQQHRFRLVTCLVMDHAVFGLTPYNNPLSPSRTIWDQSKLGSLMMPRGVTKGFCVQDQTGIHPLSVQGSRKENEYLPHITYAIQEIHSYILQHKYTRTILQKWYCKRQERMGKEIMLRTLPTSNQQINLLLYKRRIKFNNSNSTG